MKRAGIGAIILLTSLLAPSSPGASAAATVAFPTTQDKIAQTTLKAGDTAPDFALPSNVEGASTPVKLSEYRGKKNVVLVFYVLAFTGG